MMHTVEWQKITFWHCSELFHHCAKFVFGHGGTVLGGGQRLFVGHNDVNPHPAEIARYF